MIMINTSNSNEKQAVLPILISDYLPFDSLLYKSAAD